MFKVGEPLHRANPTLSAIDVGFQWYGKASQLENILGCKTNHVLKRCLKTSDVIWASKEQTSLHLTYLSQWWTIKTILMFSSLLIKFRSSWILFQKKTEFISAEFVLSSVSTKLIGTYSFQASWFNCHFCHRLNNVNG